MFLSGRARGPCKASPRSLSADEDCELSSIYRALSAFRIAGLLEEFRLPGEKQTFYSLNRHQVAASRPTLRGIIHHHHIVCRDCGRVSHLDVCLPSGGLGKVEKASGFRITEHHLEFKGVCRLR